MNQQLQEYIQKSKETGRNEEQIKHDLLTAGWAEKDVRESFSKGRPVKYAGFWLRFFAVLIDSFLFLAVGALLTLFIIVTGKPIIPGWSPSQNEINLISWAVSWMYFALMESSKYQGTIGKMMMRIKVTDMEGNRISFARATARFFGKILSGLILMIGYLMAGFTKKKQALHDMIANCLVVRK